MSEIVFSNKTSSDINKFLNKPSHALILIGQLGSGKQTTAKYIASKLLKLPNINRLDIYPYFNIVSPENNLISIDKIRELKKTFTLKTSGKDSIRRIVIIENIDSMNEESQNAILKLLEEPPDDSVLILTVANEKKIKPTVLSRVQSIRLVRPTKEEIIKHFEAQGHDKLLINKFYSFSNGSIGIISSLLNNEDDNKGAKYIDEAKAIIASNNFNRLISADKMSKNKEELTERLYSLKQVAKAALYQSINKEDYKLTKYWLNTLRIIQESENSLSKGANTKLLLTNMFTHM